MGLSDLDDDGFCEEMRKCVYYGPPEARSTVFDPLDDPSAQARSDHVDISHMLAESGRDTRDSYVTGDHAHSAAGQGTQSMAPNPRKRLLTHDGVSSVEGTTAKRFADSTSSSILSGSSRSIPSRIDRASIESAALTIQKRAREAPDWRTIRTANKTFRYKTAQTSATTNVPSIDADRTLIKNWVKQVLNLRDLARIKHDSMQWQRLLDEGLDVDKLEDYQKQLCVGKFVGFIGTGRTKRLFSRIAGATLALTNKTELDDDQRQLLTTEMPGLIAVWDATKEDPSFGDGAVLKAFEEMVD